MRLLYILILLSPLACASSPSVETASEQYIRARKAIRVACNVDLIQTTKRTQCVTDLMNSYISNLYPETKGD